MSAAAAPAGRSVACRECGFLDAAGVRCTAGGRSPLRNCVIAINRQLLERLRPGDRVLEVGCGSWSEVRSGLPAGVQWDGIDVVAEYEGLPTLATAIGSVSRIPFPAGSFDYVLANESIEHWYEFGVSIPRGMAEVSRVLRPGGEAWINFPIHLHGHRACLAGDERRLARLLLGAGWEVVRWEYWRRDHAPLERYAGWIANNAGDVTGLIPAPERASSWIMNVVLRKVATVPRGWAAPLADALADAAFRSRPLRSLVIAASRGPRYLFGKLRRRLGGAPRPREARP